MLSSHSLKVIGGKRSHLHLPQMSKSKGNVVDPFEQLAKFGVDPLRYFMLRDASLQHDSGEYRGYCRC